MDDSGTDAAECSRKVTSGRRVAGAIISLVNAWDLQIVHETLLVPVLMYGGSAMWRGWRMICLLRESMQESVWKSLSG